MRQHQELGEPSGARNPGSCQQPRAGRGGGGASGKQLRSPARGEEAACPYDAASGETRAAHCLVLRDGVSRVCPRRPRGAV